MLFVKDWLFLVSFLKPIYVLQALVEYVGTYYHMQENDVIV